MFIKSEASGFVKYQHIERLGTAETDGILDGQVYVFPKIDGTNASVWMNEEGAFCAGSRNRILGLSNDNAGFMNWCTTSPQSEMFATFLKSHPNLYLYGEWLVPHSLKTYREAAWRDFYVFDVLDTTQGLLLSYEAYRPLLEEHGINYIPPLAVIKNPDPDNIMRILDKNGYLIEDGKGVGEGIVLKNYGYQNRFGQQTWAKVVTNEFKEIHHKAMGAPEINNTLLDEDKIVEKYCTSSFIDKEKNKIMALHNTGEGHNWHSKMIPELLGRCYYELLKEETTNFVKEFKDPKINFKYLKQCVIRRVKQELGL
jgi:ATP-dependent RNA circularization protein (DNA/RNA ligase family)